MLNSRAEGTGGLSYRESLLLLALGMGPSGSYHGFGVSFAGVHNVLWPIAAGLLRGGDGN